MRHADKNRCPEAARKRAKADARCALRKLDLWARLEALGASGSHDSPEAARLLRDLMAALGLAPEKP